MLLKKQHLEGFDSMGIAEIILFILFGLVLMRASIHAFPRDGI